MKLTEKEKNSDLWAKLKEHALARIAELRESNDSPMPAEDTAATRGRIAELKEMLLVEHPDPVIEEEVQDPI